MSDHPATKKMKLATRVLVTLAGESLGQASYDTITFFVDDGVLTIVHENGGTLAVYAKGQWASAVLK